ncbi:YggT family protein [Novosphingobium sp. CF614]|nr:YggT family protein [Novosphingobium sp. CF614]
MGLPQNAVLSGQRMLGYQREIFPTRRKVRHPMLGGLFNALIYLMQVLQTVILVWFILSLLISFNVVNLHNQFVAAIWRGLNAILDPILNPIRRIMPNTGGIDFSPMVLIIGLMVIVKFMEPLVYRYG